MLQEKTCMGWFDVTGSLKVSKDSREKVHHLSGLREVRAKFWTTMVYEE